MISDKKLLTYQLDFSEHHKILFDQKNRKLKALKTISVLEDFLGSTDKLILLDIGSSTGIITKELSEKFKYSIGIDIDEKAVTYAKDKFESENLKFYIQDSLETSFPDNYFDVITCSHIYEHVPDSKKLMKEIWRLLKPGGVCYFAAGNKINIIEAHYNLPFLSLIPKFLAHKYVRIFNKADYYYECHLTYWGLKELTNQFKVFDYTKKLVRDPQKFHATDLIKSRSIKQFLIIFVMSFAYWLCPTYIWILKKD